MKAAALVLLLLGVAGFLPVDRSDADQAFQEPGKQQQIATDPQTGRAVGAREMTADELQKLIAQKAKMLLIDVRDEAQYEKETIKGAIHIPMAELESRLKEIPKDTILVFT